MGVRRALALCSAVGALTAAVAGAANPPRPTGGLAFAPATFVDPLRPLAAPVLAADGSGVFWVTGRPGVLLRSTDDGDSFRPVTAPPLGSGEADVVVDGAGRVYVAAAGDQGVSVASSSDGGVTWRAGTVPSVGAASRPWLAAGGGAVYLAVTTAGGTDVFAATGAEPVFQDVRAVLGPESSSTRCGRLVHDRTTGSLYMPCARGNSLEIVTGRPGAGDTDMVFTTSVAATSPVGPVGGPLPTLAVDGAGGVLVAWIDAGDRNLYAAVPGGAPFLVNGAGAETSALPVAIGGAPGVFALAFVATSEERDPNALPDPGTNAAGAAAVRWYGFAALIASPASTTPSIVQQRTTAKPVHFGRLCTTCAADPVLGSTIGAALEPRTGALRAVLSDASGAEHVARGSLVRQFAGPTASGQSISRPSPANGVVDGTGDAPGTPQLDLTRLELRQLNPSTLRVRMSLAAPGALAAPPGAASAVWLTRFQVLSRGAAREAAYRSLYAAAVSTGGPPRFVTGELVCAETCRAATARAATGRLEGTTLELDVDLVALSAAVALEGDLFYNVSGFTFVGDAAGNPVTLVDSLAPFDYRLDQRIGPTTGRGRRITLRGAIRGAAVTVDVFENRTGRVVVSDARARVAFRSTRIARVVVRGRTATISGIGSNRSRRTSFAATVIDRGAGRLDSFALRLSTGYRRSGRLTSGNATILGTG